jgi:hypothetical protein
MKNMGNLEVKKDMMAIAISLQIQLMDALLFL